MNIKEARVGNRIILGGVLYEVVGHKDKGTLCQKVGGGIDDIKVIYTKESQKRDGFLAVGSRLSPALQIALTKMATD